MYCRGPARPGYGPTDRPGDPIVIAIGGWMTFFCFGMVPLPATM